MIRTSATADGLEHLVFVWLLCKQRSRSHYSVMYIIEAQGD